MDFLWLWFISMSFIIVDVIHVPDILVVGKPLSNEFPMAMVDFIEFDYCRCSTRYFGGREMDFLWVWLISLRLIFVDVVPDILVVGKPLGNGFPTAMVDFIEFNYCRCSTRYFGGREAAW